MERAEEVDRSVSAGCQSSLFDRSVRNITETLGLPPLLARILVSRGIDEPRAAETFLYPRLESLSDPFLIPDMEKGVERVIASIRNEENICIYGDYDADGVTATALLSNFLTTLERPHCTYLPKREEGYGLNVQAIDALRDQGVTLIVCVDCGSTNVDEVKRAAELGMDTVIIDHHEMGPVRPPAIAVINPKQKNSLFPTRDLAACGVVFFFLVALRRIMARIGLMERPINLKKELDLVAVGSIGDMVPLAKDNRILVRYGFDVMQKRPRTWLRTFLRQNTFRSGKINEYALNFLVVPRINATGRMSEPEKSFLFLTCCDELESDRLYLELQGANRRRQKIEEQILNEALSIIEKEEMAEKRALLLFREDWHAGVIGIVAQRLVETFGKPAIVIAEVDGLCKGSGRGGQGVDLHATIAQLSHLLVRFGGHKFACGVSLRKENIEAFREAFEANIVHISSPAKKAPLADAEAEFSELTGEFMEAMELLGPFGMGNPRPVVRMSPATIFSTRGYRRIIDSTNRTWGATFPPRTVFPENVPVTVLASPIVREQRGERFIHLNVKEVIPAGHD